VLRMMLCKKGDLGRGNGRVAETQVSPGGACGAMGGHKGAQTWGGSLQSSFSAFGKSILAKDHHLPFDDGNRTNTELSSVSKLGDQNDSCTSGLLHSDGTISLSVNYPDQISTRLMPLLVGPTSIGTCLA
jgi:hypothetical protein